MPDFQKAITEHQTNCAHEEFTLGLCTKCGLSAQAALELELRRRIAELETDVTRKHELLTLTLEEKVALRLEIAGLVEAGNRLASKWKMYVELDDDIGSIDAEELDDDIETFKLVLAKHSDQHSKGENEE